MSYKDKKIFLIISVSLIIGIGIFIICNKGSDNVTLDQIKEDAKVDRKQFAMYVQDENNPESYNEYTDNSNMFPDGYTLNVGRSECEDISGNAIPTNGVVSQTSDGKVMVTSTKTVYCTFYFDINEPHSYEDLYVSDDKLLGNTEKGNDGYLIYHDGTGTYGEYEAGDYSYRFSGNNPDNYVCLDGDDNTTGACSDIKKLYRVIGWFPKEGNTSEYQMKLIKSEYLTADELGGNLSSNKVKKTSNSDFTKRVEINETVDGFLWIGARSIYWNNWKLSKLNETLNSENGTYLKSLSVYTDANLIEETKWYIGGNSKLIITKQNNMKDAYNNDLGAYKLTTSSQDCTDTSTNFVQCREDLLYQENKIGLMYVTEYGYASVPSNWSKQLYNYGSKYNRSANWLYNGVDEWTLSRQSDSTDHAFYVGNDGYVTTDYVYFGSQNGVRPVLVLKSEATIKSGDGSKEKPWRINLNNN